MSEPAVVGFSGNFTRPSKTRAFVDRVVRDISHRYGLSAETYDVEDLGPTFGGAKSPGELGPEARHVLQSVVAADVLVVGSPTYKGSYTGLFKHFFDLMDPGALRGKPVLLVATGGGERHALIVEHQMRPLFGFFEAFALPTAIYATDRDFVDGVLVSEAINARAARAVEDVGVTLAAKVKAAIAAA